MRIWIPLPPCAARCSINWKYMTNTRSKIEYLQPTCHPTPKTRKIERVDSQQLTKNQDWKQQSEHSFCGQISLLWRYQSRATAQPKLCYGAHFSMLLLRKRHVSALKVGKNHRFEQVEKPGMKIWVVVFFWYFLNNITLFQSSSKVGAAQRLKVFWVGEGMQRGTVCCRRAWPCHTHCHTGVCMACCCWPIWVTMTAVLPCALRALWQQVAVTLSQQYICNKLKNR